MQSVTKDLDLSKPKVREALETMVKALKTVLPDGSFAERERSSLLLLSEAQREFGERELQELADSFGEEVRIGNEIYRRHQRGTVRYHSLSGHLTVERYTYRRAGIRNGPTIVALELAAGLVHRATPALAENLAHGYAQHDLRAHCALLAKSHRVPPPRATAERVAKAIARDAEAQVARIEKVLLRREKVEPTARGLVVGFDRTSTPMAEKLPSEAPQSKGQRKKPYQRRPPPPIEVNWRMAYVGTVCLVDEHGEALRTTRYAATASDDPKRLSQRMHEQLKYLLKRAPHLQVAIVQDGAPEMWNQMRAVLEPLKQAGTLESWQEAIDFPHLLSRISKAFQLIGKDDPSDLEYWKLQLLNRYRAIDQLEQLLSEAADSLDEDRLEQLLEHLVYIDENKDRMRYSRLRQAGLPVGSGVTESAAKNVVNMRAKRSGQRWSVSGLRGVLTLRALQKSDRLPAFWTHLSRRYVANVVNLENAA